MKNSAESPPRETKESMDGRPRKNRIGKWLIRKQNCRDDRSKSFFSSLLRPYDASSDPIDTLIIAGGAEDGLRQAAATEEFIQWLSAQSKSVRRLASVCTGAFLLGFIGALDGRKATTHWGSCDELQSMFADINVDDDAIYTKDGNVYTSAGITAVIDLSLSLVEEDLGRAIASEIARNLVLYLRRPGGQSQFSAALQTQAQPSDRLRGGVDWMVANLNDNLAVPYLAQRAGMSERNFARIFREETGETPAKFVTRLRLDQIRLLLIDTAWPLERIASRCGFRSADVMRRSFIEAFGLTPSDYRARFGHS